MNNTKLLPCKPGIVQKLVTKKYRAVQDNGFAVESCVAGTPTSFVAIYGSSKTPIAVTDYAKLYWIYTSSKKDQAQTIFNSVVKGTSLDID